MPAPAATTSAQWTSCGLWFGIISRRVLRFGNFRSPDELIAAIEAFIDEWNRREAHPFRWTYEGHPLVA
jgi:hypothetical protein